MDVSAQLTEHGEMKPSNETSGQPVPAAVKGFLETLRRALPELRQRYGVRELGLFGSYVRSEQGRSSDLDVLVEFDSAPGFFKFIELEDFLSERLSVKVDLVMKSALKPRIGAQILAEAVTV